MNMTGQRLRNLTPHTVAVRVAHETITISPTGVIARADVVEQASGTVKVGAIEVPLLKEFPGPVTGLPAPEPGTLLIVSRVVAAASPHRDDLVVPTGFIRDEDGAIVACRAFARLIARP